MKDQKESIHWFSAKIVFIYKYILASNIKDRQVLIKFLHFESAKSQCKVVITPWKQDQQKKMNELIRSALDIWSHAYAALIGEVISANFKRKQNVRCFNCGKISHFIWKRISDKVFLENCFLFKEIIQTEGPSLLVYAESMSKISIGLMNASQQGTG